MSDITVYLTTTKWTIATDHPNHDFFVKKDVPVCCAAMIIASFGFSPQPGFCDFIFIPSCI